MLVEGSGRCSCSALRVTCTGTGGGGGGTFAPTGVLVHKLGSLVSDPHEVARFAFDTLQSSRRQLGIGKVNHVCLSHRLLRGLVGVCCTHTQIQ